MEKLQIVCSAINFSECVLKVVFKNPVVNVQTEYLSRTIPDESKAEHKRQTVQTNPEYLVFKPQLPDTKQKTGLHPLYSFT